MTTPESAVESPSGVPERDGGPVWPLVVKLGGSLAESGRIKAVLGVIANARRRIVVVPGGGAFADAVRETQARCGCSDGAAHRMALLAMHQTALMLADLEPRLLPAQSPGAFRRAWREARIPVWLPYRMVSADPLMPADWSVTSDGLAAWLASRIAGAQLVIVKSCRIDPALSPSELAAVGVIDPICAGILERRGSSWRILGANDAAALAELAALVDEPARGPSTGRVP